MQSQPPPKDPKDLIVMTRLNTNGLKRLADGTLVEKSPLGSVPPEPIRVPHRAPGAPKTLVAAEDEAYGADASEDRTVALAAADPKRVGSVENDVFTSAPPSPSAMPLASSSRGPAEPPLVGKSEPRSSADVASGVVIDARLEMETPTAMFVKDIQATLKEELAKQKASTPAPGPVFQLDALDDLPPARANSKESKSEPKQRPAVNPFEATARLEPSDGKKADPFKSVPPPPTSKPASLAPPPVKSAASLPAPLPGQANRKKDPVAVSVTNRPQRVERKGGFVAWAAALTALGVFVGVAGARVATGGAKFSFAQTAAAPAAAPATPEVGFAPRVTVPAEPAKEPQKIEAPVAEAPKVEAKVEPDKVEPTKPAAAAPEKAVAAVEKPAEKPAEKLVEAKVEKPVERRPARVARPEPVEKPEPVAKAKPERAEKPEPVAAKPKPEKVEKPEAPAKTGKSADVAAAARDYAAVESQIGQSL